MAKHTLYLGTLPANEELPRDMETYKVAYLWREDMCKAYQEQHGRIVPDSCRMLVKREGHELGDYYEVVAVFDEYDELGREAAYWFEGYSPLVWSTQALAKFNDMIKERGEVAC